MVPYHSESRNRSRSGPSASPSPPRGDRNRTEMHRGACQVPRDLKLIRDHTWGVWWATGHHFSYLSRCSLGNLQQNRKWCSTNLSVRPFYLNRSRSNFFHGRAYSSLSSQLLVNDFDPIIRPWNTWPVGISRINDWQLCGFPEGSEQLAIIARYIITSLAKLFVIEYFKTEWYCLNAKRHRLLDYEKEGVKVKIFFLDWVGQ